MVDKNAFLPMKIQDGLSENRRLEGFKKALKKLGDSWEQEIIISDIPLSKSFPEKVWLYTFLNKFVYVKESIHQQFQEHFSRYITTTNNIAYDNLLNLCIMVKNAGPDFKNILEQNKPYIDSWTILDTGSTDDTVRTIKETMSDIPGELYEEPFINFRDSRNRLLDLAGDKCWFNVMLDDSYVLCGNRLREFLDIARGDDIADSFSLVIDGLDIQYTSNRITKSNRNLRYINLIHEIIQKENNEMNIQIPIHFGYIKDISSDYMNERTSQRKAQDLEILLEMQRVNPNDSRTSYYIAETYLALKDWENAEKWFKKRLEYQTGYNVEIRDSMYYIAVLNEIYLNRPWDIVLDWYIKSYELDNTRPESLYFIGKHYKNTQCFSTAMIFFEKAFNLGIPSIDMNSRKYIIHYHLPRDMLELCFTEKNYILGERCCKRIIESVQNNIITIPDLDIVSKWYNIFVLLNKIPANSMKTIKTRPFGDTGKFIAFVCPGGWDKWDGEVLRVSGLGASESQCIEYAEMLVKLGYNVCMFCNCEQEKVYGGVYYYPLESFSDAIQKYYIDICIVSRYPEYIPLASSCNSVGKLYYLMHDISLGNEIICYNFLNKILCISEWQKNDFLEKYGIFKNIMGNFNYGINPDFYRIDLTKKIKNKFIYPSFPNRGLLPLLQMFKKILQKMPDATLDIFCDLNNKWVQTYWKSDMEQVKLLLTELKPHVINNGWTNHKNLKQYWERAEYFLYPCTFKETRCLTCYEAFITKTLVITNDLAVLPETVGERGIIIKGDSTDENWQNEVLGLFDNPNGLYEDNRKRIDIAYDWCVSQNFKDVVSKFNETYIEN